MPPTPSKKRRNVTFDSQVIREARDFGINVSAVGEAALREEVRKARAAAWLEENAESLAQHCRWIEENGPPLAAYQAFKVG